MNDFTLSVYKRLLHALLEPGYSFQTNEELGIIIGKNYYGRGLLKCLCRFDK